MYIVVIIISIPIQNMIKIRQGSGAILRSREGGRRAALYFDDGTLGGLVMFDKFQGRRDSSRRRQKEAGRQGARYGHGGWAEK